VHGGVLITGRPGMASDQDGEVAKAGVDALK